MQTKSTNNRYILLNKPVGYSTDMLHELLTEKNNVGKPAPDKLPPYSPLNNLEPDSEGLVVLTDEKEGMETLPNLEQEYEITIDHYLSKDAEHILKKGITLENKFITGIKIIEEKHKGNRSVVVATMTEQTAKNIRNFFEIIGFHVTAVRCIRVGEFKLGVLSIGKWKTTTDF